MRHRQSRGHLAADVVDQRLRLQVDRQDGQLLDDIPEGVHPWFKEQLAHARRELASRDILRAKRAGFAMGANPPVVMLTSKSSPFDRVRLSG